MSATEKRTLLLSIRPKFAEMIFNGSKRVELRRRRPRVCAGDKVYVYMSSPVRALVGEFVVQRVLSSSVDDLWDIVRDCAGITQEHFEEYYSGTDLGYAIFVAESTRLPSPIELDDLRRIWRGFRPPQCYAYLSHNELSLIEGDPGSNRVVASAKQGWGSGVCRG